MILNFFLLTHRRKRVENPGGGGNSDLCLRGQGFPDKTARGDPYFGFY